MPFDETGASHVRGKRQDAWKQYRLGEKGMHRRKGRGQEEREKDKRKDMNMMIDRKEPYRGQNNMERTLMITKRSY
eukprot:7269207-Alexandrium_andersonii.AAC.1